MTSAAPQPAVDEGASYPGAPATIATTRDATSTFPRPTETASASAAPTAVAPTTATAPTDPSIDSPVGSSFLRNIGIDAFLPLGTLLAVTIGGLSAGLLVRRRGTADGEEAAVPLGAWSLSSETDGTDPTYRELGAAPSANVHGVPSPEPSPRGLRRRHRLTSV